ncbi:hypothetical protein [Streptomyces sp. NPDC054849]
MDTNDRGLLDIERFDLEPDRPLFHGRVGTTTAADVRGLDRDQTIRFLLDVVVDAAAEPRVDRRPQPRREPGPRTPGRGEHLKLRALHAGDHEAFAWILTHHPVLTRYLGVDRMNADQAHDAFARSCSLWPGGRPISQRPCAPCTRARGHSCTRDEPTRYLKP